MLSKSADNTSVTRTKGELVCFYCKKPGHKISDCIALKNKEKGVKHVGLISTSDVKHTPARFNQQIERVDVTEMESVKNNADFAPFLTEGTVALPNSDETVPVRILRDTGAGQSFLMEGLLPLSERTATGTQVLVRGLEMGCTEVPLHRIHLNSKLVSGDVVVGVRAMLPVPGVTFILGNDLGRAHTVRFLIIFCDCCLSHCTNMIPMSNCRISVVLMSDCTTVKTRQKRTYSRKTCPEFYVINP